MTYAPATLTSSAGYLVAHKGGNLGIVGDTAHQRKGVSYISAGRSYHHAYSAGRPATGAD